MSRALQVGSKSLGDLMLCMGDNLNEGKWEVNSGLLPRKRAAGISSLHSIC